MEIGGVVEFNRGFHGIASHTYDGCPALANEKHRLRSFLAVRITRPFLEALLRLGSRCRRRDVDRAGARRVGWKERRWFAAPLQEMDKVW